MFAWLLQPPTEHLPNFECTATNIQWASAEAGLCREPAQSYPADHHAVSHDVSRHSCVSRPNRLILLANEAPQLADAIRLISSHVRQTDQAPAGKNQSCLVWGRRGGQK